VNDVFVLDAWAKASGARDTVTFLANGDRDFAKSIGLEMDGTPSGLGIRSKRYAMLVEDGVVTALHVEDTPRNAVESSAERLLTDLWRRPSFGPLVVHAAHAARHRRVSGFLLRQFGDHGFGRD
jgi:redoxin